MPRGHPVMLPMIDVVEVGAGGGRIAWIDEVGALKVGPQSAGADPGPICYRGGGTEPTITDANVVLGRLDPDNFLGGTMKLDAEGARRGIDGQDRQAAEDGHRSRPPQAILEIAIAKMSLAVREVSVQKGYDPRDFALVASGGAGPAACAGDRARTAHPEGDRAAVPVAFLRAGHAARGRAPRLHPHVLFRPGRASILPDSPRSTMRWRKRRRRVCVTPRMPNGRSHLDLRYVGQEFTLSVPVTREQLVAGDREGIRARLRRALRAPLRASLAGRAGRDGQHPPRHDRQARAAGVPAACAAAGAVKPAQHRRRSISAMPPSRSIARSISASSCPPVRDIDGPGADPGARHDHRAVRAGRLRHGAVRAN